MRAACSRASLCRAKFFVRWRVLPSRPGSLHTVCQRSVPLRVMLLRTDAMGKRFLLLLVMNGAARGRAEAGSAVGAADLEPGIAHLTARHGQRVRKRKPGLHDQEDIELARLECGSEVIGIGRDFDLLHSGLSDRLVEKAPRLGSLLLIAHGMTNAELVGWRPTTRRLLQGHGQRRPSAGGDPPPKSRSPARGGPPPL